MELRVDDYELATMALTYRYILSKSDKDDQLTSSILHEFKVEQYRLKSHRHRTQNVLQAFGRTA